MHTPKNHVSLFIIIITFFMSQISFTRGAPLLPRRLPIPAAPADPPAPPGDGIGPYNSQPASLSDRLAKKKFYAIAVAAGGLGLSNARNNLWHYLGNSGNDKYISAAAIMKGLPQFQEKVRKLVQAEAAIAYKQIPTTKGEKSFSSKWYGFYATKSQSSDWYYSLGGFSYSVTGVVEKSGSELAGTTLRYQVHIFDRYNWDSGKSVDIGPFHFEDKELGNLHLKGLAREYVVRGKALEFVYRYTPTTVIPSPVTEEGGR